MLIDGSHRRESHIRKEEVERKEGKRKLFPFISSIIIPLFLVDHPVHLEPRYNGIYSAYYIILTLDFTPRVLPVEGLRTPQRKY